MQNATNATPAYYINISIPLATKDSTFSAISKEAALFDELALAINAIVAKHSSILTEDETYNMFIVDERFNAVY